MQNSVTLRKVVLWHHIPLPFILMSGITKCKKKWTYNNNFNGINVIATNPNFDNVYLISKAWGQVFQTFYKRLRADHDTTKKNKCKFKPIREGDTFLYFVLILCASNFNTQYFPRLKITFSVYEIMTSYNLISVKVIQNIFHTVRRKK